MNLDFGPVFSNFQFLLGGLEGTLKVSAGALVVGSVLGLAIALLRLARLRVLRFFGGLYVDFMRSVPLVVLLVWFVYALPIVFETVTGQRILIDPLIAGMIGIGIYEAAYLAEVFRSGVLAVPVGQREAAISTGMSGSQAMRRVILPQAFQKIIPPATSTILSLVKDSSVAFAVAVPELIARAGSLNNQLQKPVEVFLVVAGIYLVITYPLLLISDRLQKRAAEAA